MCMCDKDMTDGFPFKALLQCVNMCGIKWTRINYGDIAGADNIGTRAHKGEAAGILSRHPAYPRRNLLQFAVFKVIFVDKGNLCCHAAFQWFVFCGASVS